MREKTLALIKPDAVKRQLLGEIISFMEQDFSIEFLRVGYMFQQQATLFYAAQHYGKPYFENLVNFTTSGQLALIIMSGEDAIRRWRRQMGSAKPEDREKGTIREMYCLSGAPLTENLVHGSDSFQALLYEASVMREWGVVPENLLPYRSEVR